MRSHRTRLIFNLAEGIIGLAAPKSILYGGQKADGGHDHRTNKGSDRTPAQKAGDGSRRGPRTKGA